MIRDRNLNVLLVEDNPADAFLFQERFRDLAGLDVNVRHVTSLGEAIRASRSTRFDLTVLDLNLPDSTGPDTLRRFRREHGHGALIVLTGIADDEMEQLTRGEDVQDIIHKDESSGLLLARGMLYAVERHHAQMGRRQLEKLVSYNPDAVLVVDNDGLVQYVNEAALELFGRTREDFIGERLGFSIAEGEMTEIEVVRSGDRRTAAMHVVHFDWEGQPATLASMRDVTATKELNEQLRQAHKMEAIGRLTGGVAHDFNNLLTVILGYANFLLSHDVPRDVARGQLAEIAKAGNRAAALTRQLLLYSRSAEASPVPIALGKLVRDLESLLQRLIGEDIQLVVDPVADLWPVVADPMQVEQVIMNMAVNARDAMPEGGNLMIDAYNTRVAESQAAAWFDLEAGDYVILAITDTGEGMSTDTASRIFEPFYTTKEVGKGTGLGLATSYGIIKNAGGHVDVRSEPGCGTTFRIYLPRGEGIDENAWQALNEPRSLAGRETVLLVEDDDSVRNLARMSLDAQGYTVLEASSGAQALTIAAEHEGSIDLLLTDVIMPRMNGPQLMSILRRSHPQLRVLFMSGYTGGHASETFSQIPRDADTLDKPFAPSALAGKVREVLDRGVIARSSED